MVAQGERKPAQLDYSPVTAPKSGWPVGLYTIALIWAVLAMHGYTAATTAYRDESRAAFRTQIALVACATVRLVWARVRREQGRGWLFYIVLLFSAPILWAVFSPWLARLGYSLWGGH